MVLHPQGCSSAFSEHSLLCSQLPMEPRLSRHGGPCGSKPPGAPSAVGGLSGPACDARPAGLRLGLGPTSWACMLGFARGLGASR